MVCKIFENISKGKACHDDFANDCNKNMGLVREILSFGLYITGCDQNDTIDSVYNKLKIVSTELNIQIKIYSNEEVVSINQNPYACAIVVSIYYFKQANNYFALYHENYDKIAVENLNASDEFFDVEPQNDITKLDKIANLLLDSLDETVLTDSEKWMLNEKIESIGLVTSRAVSLKEKLNKL